MATYEFRCPACGEQITMNASMRDVVLAEGCPVCAADVSAQQFVEVETD